VKKVCVFMIPWAMYCGVVGWLFFFCLLEKVGVGGGKGRSGASGWDMIGWSEMLFCAV
jgi:hypothetical protein